MYKSEDRMIAGVCGGVAEYLDLDPTFMRIIYIVICFFGCGFPIVIYPVAALIIPKRPANYSDYIDVKGATEQAARPFMAVPYATSSGAASASNNQAQVPSPGRAYTTANPEAFDAPRQQSKRRRSKGLGAGVQSGVIFGIIFIGLGVLGVLGLLIHASLWRYWPIIVAAIGVFVLLSPSRKGWSLQRAGNGFFLITLAAVMQAWVFGYLDFEALLQMSIFFWPALLVMFGLTVIAGVTKKTIFNLFGSLVLCASLLVGVWTFGKVPGMDVNVNIPLIEDRNLNFSTPSSPGVSPHDDQGLREFKTN